MDTQFTVREPPSDERLVGCPRARNRANEAIVATDVANAHSSVGRTPAIHAVREQRFGMLWIAPSTWASGAMIAWFNAANMVHM